MRRFVFLSTATALFLLSPLSNSAQQQDAPRRRTPTLTTEEARPSGAGMVEPEINVTKSEASGSQVINARAILQNTLGKMAEINSLRTRMRAILPTGEREMTIDSVKPDRVRVVAAEGEMIFVGRKVYSKTGESDWQVIPMPAGGQYGAARFDFQALLKQLLNDSRVRITGQILGDERIDDVDALVYEFTVRDDKPQVGVMQISVGKKDGCLRRLFISGPDVKVKIWFSNINEPLSIEPPM